LAESSRLRHAAEAAGKDIYELMDDEADEKERERKARVRAEIAAEPEEARIMRIATAKA